MISYIGITPYRTTKHRTPNGEREEKDMAKITTTIQMFDYDNGKQLVKVYYESGAERNFEKGKEPKTVSAWMKDNDYDWKELNQFEAEIVEEKEIERNPFGMVACMASVRTHVETFGEDPFEMLAEYEQRAKEDVFFNKTMIDAVRQYIEEHELTQEQESEGEEMTAEQKIEAKKEAREAINKAIEAYNGTDRPSEAVAMLVESVGYDEAKRIIATLVNAVSLHDGRIYDRTRTWANSVTEAPTNEQLRDMGIYGVDSWIHSCHVDQLGEAMRKYEPPQEEPTEQEPTEEAPKTVHIGDKYMTRNEDGSVLVLENGSQYLTGWDNLTDEEKALFGVEPVEDLTPTETDTQSDLERQCKGIRDTLEAVYNGEMVADEDGCVDGVDYGLFEGDSVTMWDFFSHSDGDVFDIEYSVDGDGDYRGVRLMVACGGPNIYINTRRGEVEGYWWTDSASVWLPSEVCESIDDVWSEYYSMMIG